MAIDIIARQETKTRGLLEKNKALDEEWKLVLSHLDHEGVDHRA